MKVCLILCQTNENKDIAIVNLRLNLKHYDVTSFERRPQQFHDTELSFHLTWNRVIAAVGTNWKILASAIFCSTFKVQKAFIITITISFLYSTLASIFRGTAFQCL